MKNAMLVQKKAKQILDKHSISGFCLADPIGRSLVILVDKEIDDVIKAELQTFAKESGFQLKLVENK